MTTAAIETHDLRKTYRRVGRSPHKALDGLDLQVEQGRVQGFLGPNGSGKTTTIRVLLGLARADGGTQQILGHEVPRHLHRVVGEIGALVENPLFLPGMTGRTHLDLLARSVGVPRSRVDAVLDMVHLRERADDRVKGYSLGMRQRLGIAAALLKDPRLLILDEPSNGLDPAGMKEVRELVRELAAGGRTIFISSHLLAEVQHVCDHVTIMSRGRALVSGPVDEVLRAHTAPGVTLRVSDITSGGPSPTGPAVTAATSAAAVAALVLREAGYDVVPLPDGGLQVGSTGRPVVEPADLTRLLGGHDLWISALAPLATDLESAFLEITAGHGLGEQPPPGEHRGEGGVR